MEFSRKYQGQTQVASSAAKTTMSFVPDALRKPTFFVAELARHLLFREAMSALHHVVVSDLRFQPKDKTDYKAWLKEQEALFLAEAMSQQADKKVTIAALKAELRHPWYVLTDVCKCKFNFFGARFVNLYHK